MAASTQARRRGMQSAWVEWLYMPGTVVGMFGGSVGTRHPFCGSRLVRVSSNLCCLRLHRSVPCPTTPFPAGNPVARPAGGTSQALAGGREAVAR